MKSKIIGLLLVAVSLSFGQLLNNNSFTAVKIGKTEISKGKIDSLVQYTIYTQSQGQPQNVPPEMAERVKYMVVESMIADELVRIEAEANNFAVTAKLVDSAFTAYKKNFQNEQQFKAFIQRAGVSELEFKQKLEGEVKKQKFLASKVKVQQTPTVDDMKKFFNENKAQMPINDSVSAAQIYIKLDKKETAQSIEDKKAILNGLAAQVNSRRADFATLAAQNSDDPDARKTGGVMSPFVFKDLDPAFAKAAKGLELKKVSKAFKSKNAVHILMILERNDGKFESYEDRIGAILYQQALQQQQMDIAAYIKSLQAKHKVVYVDPSYKVPESLAGQGPTGAPTAPAPGIK